ncbi:MAG TPA: hypothetical protein VJ276_21900 [Thermoanaerobaculia bacterium]|nr:hypothetical protein [Thermoanaerobaculia bacterium]
MDARLELHRAVQPAAAVGRALLPPQPDSGHESFTWSDGRLVQGVVDAPRPFRAGLRFADLSLLLLGSDETIIDELPLDGRTLNDGYTFYEQRCSELLGRDVRFERIGEPHTFQANPPELAKFARLYAEADALLREVHLPVRCWPHHFDIATLIPLGGERTLGIGMSPGDTTHGEPYYYVTPWPYPAVDTLPPLAVGAWNTDGWVGAVLPASAPREQLACFVKETLRA